MTTEGGRRVEAGYDERLTVPLRWWALATMFLASLLLSFLVALPPSVAFTAAGVLTLGLVALFLRYGAARVSLRQGRFSAGRASIPATLLSNPQALDAQATRRVLGTEADARAYLLVRPYLRRSVRVEVADPADPAPYWLVSTRHPRRLATALQEAIETAGNQRRPG